MAIIDRSTISKKTGKKIGRFYVQFYDPTVGKHVLSPRYYTRKEAVKAEAEYLNKMGTGAPIRRKTCLFSEAAELWLSTYKAKYADKTYTTYRQILNRSLLPLFGDVRIDRITSTNILRWKAEMEALYKPETVNKQYNILTNVFNFARDVMQALDRSPMERIPRCTVPQRKKPTWTVEDLRYFLAVPEVRESSYYPAILLAAVTGMRPGEICGLSESDLTAEKILLLNRGYTTLGTVSDLKTERSHRPIRLPDPVYEVLQAHLSEKRRRLFRMRQTGDFDERAENDFLLVNPYGRPINPNVLSKKFSQLIRLNNSLAEDKHSGHEPLPVIPLYSLRHSFATNLLLQGHKSKIISEIMGNSVNTMEHHYAHIREEMSAETLTIYGEELLSAPPAAPLQLEKNEA